MPRFYDGQPVTCIWEAGKWRLRVSLQQFIPTRGRRYVVLLSVNDRDGVTRVVLTASENSCWNEAGFAPVTEDQVRAIEAMSTDVPDEIKKELENA